MVRFFVSALLHHTFTQTTDYFLCFARLFWCGLDFEAVVYNFMSLFTPLFSFPDQIFVLQHFPNCKAARIINLSFTQIMASRSCSEFQNPNPRILEIFRSSSNYIGQGHKDCTSGLRLNQIPEYIFFLEETKVMIKKAPPWTSSLAATKPRLWWVACTILGGHWTAPHKLCWARARVQIGWWQTSSPGRYSRPWPWHSPAGPVAIHCAAGSPFVTVSQLTSPPEHPQFSVFPHEKIHGNL